MSLGVAPPDRRSKVASECLRFRRVDVRVHEQ